MLTQVIQNKIRTSTSASHLSNRFSEYPLIDAIVDELRPIRGDDAVNLERDARKLLRDAFAALTSKPVAA